MVSSYITRAAAIRILVDAIKREYFGELDVCRALKISWSEGLLLPTGAKLVRRPDGWCIHGYAADGRDVFEYIERAHLRRQPYRGEIMTPEAFEAKRREFDTPIETKVRPRLRTQHSNTPSHLAVETTTISARRLVSRTGKSAGFRPSRNRAGKWERFF